MNRPRPLARAAAWLALSVGLFSPAFACDRCRTTTANAPGPIDTATLLRELDQRAAAAANARPSVAFPARIGIARLESGRVTAMPPEEWEAWRRLGQQTGPDVAVFSPVSALVAQSLTPTPLSRTPHDAISHLRLAAAREQLDLVLLYDVTIDHTLDRTEATLLDATIVGAWLFPTHRSHATAHASGTLIDVRSGLGYGSALGQARDVCSATLLGSQDKLHEQRIRVARKAVAELAPEMGRLLGHVSRTTAGNTREARSRAAHSRVEDTPAATAHPARGAAATDAPSNPPVEVDDGFWTGR